MSAQKIILVACGTAVANATVVGNEIKEAIEKHGIPVTIVQCNASEIPMLAQDADLIVTTTLIDADLSKPVIQTWAFITGIRKEAVIDKIIDTLESY